MELQTTAIETYKRNPDLLEEHVRQEDSFRFGGYGTRQISELLQNATDALGNTQGRIEFRVANRALYCANEGTPFDRDGVRAVSMAFLSEKRGDQIGRFGLGFKSLLGITNNPQVHGRDASFQFNGPGVEHLFGDIRSQSGRLPVMRIPSPIDSQRAREEDPHLAELSEWASTVVKIPLMSGGDRIRKELSELDIEMLLFMPSIRELVVSTENMDGSLTVMRRKRVESEAGDEVKLIGPDGTKTRWLFADRRYEPTPEILATLPDTAKRTAMTVSYAVPASGRASMGRFWAWFPLKDETTASGIFNAPWQVNDDRTTMLASSALNGALLDICAELFLDVAIRASKPEDPAAHLELFPGRGKEIRGPGDFRLSESIPKLARSREIIPDGLGILRSPGSFHGFPEAVIEEDGRVAAIPEEMVKIWQAQVSRSDTPHSSCYRSSTRSSRLRALTRGENERARGEVKFSAWLEELAHVGTPEAIAASLDIVIALRRRGGDDVARFAAIVPTTSGPLTVDYAVATALLPVEEYSAPDSIPVVEARFAADNGVRSRLEALGMKSASASSAVQAVGPRMHRNSSDSEWLNFWTLLGSADRQTCLEAIDEIHARQFGLKVFTESGEWRTADTVFAKSSLGSIAPARRAALSSVAVDILFAAGCLQDRPTKRPADEDGLYVEYRRWLTDEFTAAFKMKQLRLERVILDGVSAFGPLDILAHMTEAPADAARWTRALLGTEVDPEREYTATAIGGQALKSWALSFERWALSKYGQVATTLGPRPANEIVGASMDRFAAILPVAGDRESGFFDSPRTLASVPHRVLVRSFSPDMISAGTRLGSDVLVEYLAELSTRNNVRPAQAPAFLKGHLAWVATNKIVLAKEEDVSDLDVLGVPWLPGGTNAATALAAQWLLQDAQSSLARSIDVEPGSIAELVGDVFPSLRYSARKPIDGIRFERSPKIVRRVTGAGGANETRLRSALSEDGMLVSVDADLDLLDVLLEISKWIDLGLRFADADRVLSEDDKLRKSELIQRCRAATSDAHRLLILVGVDALREELPIGLLDVIESRRGSQDDVRVAEFFIEIHADDALRVLRGRLTDLDAVPRNWAGSDAAKGFVESLGFGLGFAGTASVSKPASVQVQGWIELSPLHDYQEDLACQIRDHVLNPLTPKRALLELPTGAGKTRVTVEAVVRMVLKGELNGPILWIAQSEELCEQAVQTWTDVWRSLGGARVLQISRFWDTYSVEEADADAQVVISIDDKLRSQIESHSPTIAWLSTPTLVLIDEAHAATTKTYTEIFAWLGLTATRTERPLIGLTATAFKGRSEATNRTLALRFGESRLQAFKPDDALAQLRSRGVLSDVNHRVLKGRSYLTSEKDLAEMKQLREVNRTMLDRVGADLERTQLLLNDLLEQPIEWPILVFTPSVASAHTLASLLRLEGRTAVSVDGGMRRPARRGAIERFKSGEVQFMVNCDLLTQGFDAPKVRALYIARPTFSPNRYIQMVGRGLRGPANGGTKTCSVVNVSDTFAQFGAVLAYTEFDYLWQERK